MKTKPNMFSLLVGTGTYGAVYLCQDEESSYVLKRVKMGQASLREETILSVVTDNKLPFLNHMVGGSFLHEEKQDGWFKVLPLSFAKGGDLSQHISRYGCLPESSCRRIFQQLLIAMMQLYRHDILHRDIKPENVYLVPRSPKFEYEDDDTFAFDIELGDFGLACRTWDRQHLQRCCGSVVFVAPELVRNPIAGNAHRALQSDLYSAVLVLCEMLTGCHPYSKWFDRFSGRSSHRQNVENVAKLFSNARRFDAHVKLFLLRHKVSDSLSQLIGSALVLDPWQRPSLHDLFNHEWTSKPQNLS
jgi:serine/threonine protein kinase